MFNKKAFGVLATAALVFAPVAAFAQETQVNSQSAGNSGVAAGHGNLVIQNVDQTSVQDQLSVDGYYNGSDPQTQISKQDAHNSGAAVGAGNTMIQNVDQLSGQIQTDLGY
jgi:hypothetical protein